MVCLIMLKYNLFISEFTTLPKIIFKSTISHNQNRFLRLLLLVLTILWHLKYNEKIFKIIIKIYK